MNEIKGVQEVSSDPKEWDGAFGYAETEAAAQLILERLEDWQDEIWLTEEEFAAELEGLMDLLLNGYLEHVGEDGEYLSCVQVTQKFIDALPMVESEEDEAG